MIIKPNIVLSFLLLFNLPSFAQNLTGTWEGKSGGELFQINILQEKDDEICGYTYDYMLDNKKSYCRAYFKGTYNKKLGRWDLNGLSFIENSGSHVLMTIRLWKDFDEGLILSGYVIARSEFGFMLSLGSRDDLILRRVSRTPTKLPRNLPLCYTPPEEPKDPPVVKKEPVKPKDPPIVKKDPVKPNPPVVKKDPVKPKDPPIVKRDPVRVDSGKLKPPVIKKIVDSPVVRVIPKKDSIIVLPQKVKERKSNTFSRIQVHVKTITLSLYDNATVDGDTISVYYNGRLLVNKQRLTEKAININLELDEHAAQHEITLFAHNLGAIPPNTALIVVTAGDKRYELHAKSDLQENAVLVFEYSPK
jgi:hypothetical protein